MALGVKSESKLPRATGWKQWHSALAGLAMLICGVATAISPILGIGLFLFIAAVIGFSRSGVFATCVFILASIFPIITNYVGPSLSPVKLFGAALIIVAFAAFFTTRDQHHVGRAAWSIRPLPIALLLSYMTFAAASILWATDAGVYAGDAQRLWTNGFAMIAVGVLITRMSGLWAVAITVLLGATAASIYGIILGTNFAGRAIGTYADPNEYAAVLVPAFIFGYVLVDAATKRWQQVAGCMCMLILLYELLETQSRGGLVALIAGVLALTISSHGKERLRLIGFVLVMAAIGTAFMLGTPQGQDLFERSFHGDSSGRSDLWRVAENQFSDHPIVGVGLGNFAPLAPKYISADVRRTNDILAHPKTTHNAYLQSLAELGLVGTILWLSFLLSCIVVLIRGIRTARKWGDVDADRLGRGYLSAIIGILVTIVFLSGQYQQLLWVLLGCTLVFAACVAPRTADGDYAEIAR